MALHRSAVPARFLLPVPAAFALTLAMALAYTAIDIRQFPEPVQSLVAFVPAAASLAALRAAGFSREELNLRFARISRPGLLALGGVTLLLLPVLGSGQGWTGWQWLPALVYGPASGVAQELYFRSALLSGLGKAFEKPLPLEPAPSLRSGRALSLLKEDQEPLPSGRAFFANCHATGCSAAVCKNRGRLALAAHSLIFVGFHLRTFLSLPSFPIALVVGAVLFIGGYGWGWQVQRDRTVLWAMPQHCTFLMLMSMFAW